MVALSPAAALASAPFMFMVVPLFDPIAMIGELVRSRPECDRELPVQIAVSVVRVLGDMPAIPDMFIPDMFELPELPDMLDMSEEPPAAAAG